MIKFRHINRTDDLVDCLQWHTLALQMLTLRFLLAETWFLSLEYYVHTCSYDECSIRKVPRVTRKSVKEERSLHCQMSLSNCTGVSLCLWYSSYNWFTVSSWHEFKNSFAVEISLMHWQPFKTIISAFHCSDLGEATSSYVALVFRISSSTRVAFTFVLNVLAQPMLSTSRTSVCNFRTTQYFLSCCAVIRHHHVNLYQLAVNFVEEKCFASKNGIALQLFLRTRFPLPLLLHVSFFHE
jgi:hypothetical protein